MEEEYIPFPYKTVIEHSRGTKRNILQVPSTGGREDSILHWMRGMVPRRMHAHSYQNEKKTQSMSGIVDYNSVYIIVYIFFLIHICVHLDMLNINEIIVHPQ